jgi:repressor of nif and glnA expression
MEKKGEKEDVYRVSGSEIMKKIEEIIHEGNARRIIIKNEKNETILEFPVTVGVIGIVLAPILAAVGALAAIVSNVTIVVERRK